MNQNLIDSHYHYYYNNHHYPSKNLNYLANDSKNFNIFMPYNNHEQNKWNQQNQANTLNSFTSGYYSGINNSFVNNVPSFSNTSCFQKNYYQGIVTVNPAMQCNTFSHTNIMMKPGIQATTINPMMNHVMQSMNSQIQNIPQIPQSAQNPFVSSQMPNQPNMCFVPNMRKPMYIPSFYNHQYNIPFNENDTQFMSKESAREKDSPNNMRIVKAEDTNYDKNKKSSTTYVADEGYIVEEPESDTE